VKVHTNEEGKVQKVEKVEKVENGENGEKVEKGVGKEEVGREGKRTEKEKVKEEVKRMIDEAGKNRKFGVTCQICKVGLQKFLYLYTDIYKLEISVCFSDPINHPITDLPQILIGELGRTIRLFLPWLSGSTYIEKNS